MLLDNIYTIRSVIDLAGGQIEKFKVQKIVYILQELICLFDRAYDFKWHYYSGVYSRELAIELRLGEKFKFFKEIIEEKDGYLTSYFKANESLDVSYFEKQIKNNEKIKELIEYLNMKTIQELETLTFIIYFKKDGLNDQEIREKFFSLRIYLKEFLKEAFNSYNKINEMFNKIKV